MFRFALDFFSDRRINLLSQNDGAVSRFVRKQDIFHVICMMQTTGLLQLMPGKYVLFFSSFICCLYSNAIYVSLFYEI